LRLKSYIAVFLVAGFGSLVIAQQKVTTPEELDKTMKKVQPAMQAAQKALKSEAYADARAQLAIVKQAMDDSHEFWVLHKKEDAIKSNRDTVAKLEEVDKLLAATPVDTAAVAATMKAVGGACLSCHKVYRERDADNNYILKPGSIGG
jgi:cytochrome c556